MAEGANVLLPLPAPLRAPVTQLQTDLSQALRNGHGLLARVPAADVAAVYADAQLIIQVAQPLIAGTDATVASPALDTEMRAAAAANLMTLPNPGGIQIRAVNPNLFALAAQYLGNPALWQSIATASGITPPDPQPTGSFLIIIPLG